MSNNLIPLQGMQVPAYMQQVGMTREQIAAMNAGAVMGTGGGGVNKISLKQSRFRLIVGGQETMIIPSLAINVVAVRVNDYISKTFYEKEWNPNDDPQTPDCSSDDGIRPRADAPKPQCGPDGLCQNCPQNQWGSKINAITKEKIKACTDTKRMAIVAPAPDGRFAGGGDLYQLSVPPASLKEWGTCVRQLASLPTPVSYNAVVLELSFDPTVSYPKLLFKPVRYLEQDEFMAVYDRYDKDETKRVAGLADAQTMRNAPMQLAGPAPVQQIQQQAPVQQQYQQAPQQVQAQPMQQVVQQPQQVQGYVDPNAGAAAGWGNQQPQQVQQPAPQQQQAPAATGWGNPAPAQQMQQAPVQQPQVQQQAPAAAGWGNPAPAQQPVVEQPQVQQQAPVQQTAPQQTQQAPAQSGFTGQYQNGVPVMAGGRLYGKPSGDRSRRTKVEIAEDEAFDIQRQAQGGQQAVQQPAPQQQAPVQQAAPVEQQQAPAATGWGNPAPAQQAQQQAPAFDPNNPFAGAPGAQQQQTGAPNQPGVVASGDLNAAFAGWDDGAQH